MKKRGNGGRVRWGREENVNNRKRRTSTGKKKKKKKEKKEKSSQTAGQTVEREDCARVKGRRKQSARQRQRKNETHSHSAKLRHRTRTIADMETNPTKKREMNQQKDGKPQSLARA